jgi:hypothetical protein
MQSGKAGSQGGENHIREIGAEADADREENDG